MHKSILLIGIPLVLFTIQGVSQITITSSNLPMADDTLVTQNATILVDVDLEATGAGFAWDFGDEVLSILPAATEIPCYNVDETPLTYQFLFNNPFLYPNHNSDYGNGVAAFNVATVSFEDAYMYYKNSGGKFSITGMGASINGIPLAAQKIDPELLFNTPLHFQDQGSSYSEMEFTVPGFGFYGQTVDRSYVCDGWGTMSIAGSSYEVLRIRSEVAGTDSVFAELFSFGLQIPRPATVEYTWYTPSFKVPLLQIITSDNVVTSVRTAPLVPIVSVESLDRSVLVYPNPAHEYLHLPASSSGWVITDGMGKIVARTTPGGAQRLDTTDWTSGLYQVGDAQTGQTQTILIAH